MDRTVWRGLGGAPVSFMDSLGTVYQDPAIVAGGLAMLDQTPDLADIFGPAKPKLAPWYGAAALGGAGLLVILLMTPERR